MCCWGKHLVLLGWGKVGCGAGVTPPSTECYSQHGSSLDEGCMGKQQAWGRGGTEGREVKHWFPLSLLGAAHAKSVTGHRGALQVVA